MPYARDPEDTGSVLIELYRVGNAVKVSAVDPVTMTEVCVQGTSNMHEYYLRQAAVRKLRHVLRRKAQQA